MKILKNHLAIAACLIDLNATAPPEIQLTPAGIFAAQDGRPIGLVGWKITAELAQQIIIKANAKQGDFVIDYEHQTLNSAKNGQPAPAAGWFKELEWREGLGLFAVKVRWTDSAATAITANEYRYISPVLHYDPATGDVNNILMAALVNAPALDGMESLTALAAAYFNPPQEQPMDLTQLIKLLGLADGSDMTAITAAIKELQATADKASGEVEALKAQTPDPAKYAPVETMAALQNQLATLTGQINGDKVAALITTALSDGRLLPAQKEWAEKLGVSDLAALSSYLDTAPKIAALANNQTGGNAPAQAVDVLDASSITAAALAFQFSEQQAGRTISGAEAVAHVTKTTG